MYHEAANVMPNYRLTPTHPHPAQEEDIISVLDWIGASTAAHELDLEPLGGLSNSKSSFERHLLQ
jgi:acetyl esterase/lipase